MQEIAAEAIKEVNAACLFGCGVKWLTVNMILHAMCLLGFLEQIFEVINLLFDLVLLFTLASIEARVFKFSTCSFTIPSLVGLLFLIANPELGSIGSLQRNAECPVQGSVHPDDNPLPRNRMIIGSFDVFDGELEPVECLGIEGKRNSVHAWLLTRMQSTPCFDC
jgi:hypothetical protein